VKRVAESFALTTAVVLLLVATPVALAISPTWAKKAVAFPSQCDVEANGADKNASPRTALAPLPTTTACKPVSIPSPDGRSRVEVAYKKVKIEPDYLTLQAYLRVATPNRGTHDAALPEGFQNIDLLWSPDSHAFFVNGGNGGAYWGFWVYVYLADDPTEPRDVTEAAQRDMLKEFPPCKAAYPNGKDATGCKEGSRDIDVETCMETEADPKYSPEYNMTGIDWVNASTILVMAEVPCSSSYGGIMCQVRGYELEVPTGRILKRLDAKQLKLGWQKSMAWNFRIPDPPQYCE
jgi:hypothetical protein